MNDLRSKTQAVRVATLLLAAVAVLSLASCARNIAPDAQPAYRQLQAVRIINDVDATAIAANRAKRLSDDDTAAVLTVTWQARDYIEANPTTTRARIITALQEAQDALPPDVRARVSSYIMAGIKALTEVQQ